MPASHFFADSPAEIGLNPDKVQALFDRAEREIKEGVLPACQLAIARNGKIGMMHTFGEATQGGAKRPATDETIFVIGPLGAVLSVPLTLLAKALLIDIDSRTRWMSMLMAGGQSDPDEHHPER